MHKHLFLLICFLAYVRSATAQEIMASEIIARLNAGQAITLEDVRITGDLDLTQLTRQMNDAVYPEQGKTAYVFSNLIGQPVVFNRCTFAGRLILCRKETRGDSILEYRVVFTQDVTWRACVFEQDADFELTNFDGRVSFRESTFLKQPRFVRIGLTQPPDLTGLVLRDKCLYQRYQRSQRQYLTAVALQALWQQP